jgi:hypothetical protein
MEESFQLYELDQEYAIKPTSSQDAILISHKHGGVEFVPQFTAPSSKKPKQIYGIYGSIPLLAGHYLLVITKRLQVGKLQSSILYKAIGSQVIIPKSAQSLLSPEKVHQPICPSITQTILRLSEKRGARVCILVETYD